VNWNFVAPGYFVIFAYSAFRFCPDETFWRMGENQNCGVSVESRDLLTVYGSFLWKTLRRMSGQNSFISLAKPS
jgi:hypothetical protein